MVLGICRLDFHIHQSSSLKEKRQVIKSVMGKVKSRFNVSIAEIGDHELRQKSCIGICVIGNERAYINSVLDRIINYVEALNIAEMVNHTIEIESYS
ncbi:MAG: DUF503 domain-containing protein [Thermodesulfobacteriota bacterium]